MKTTVVGGKGKVAQRSRADKREGADTFKDVLKAQGDATRSKGRTSSDRTGVAGLVRKGASDLVDFWERMPERMQKGLAPIEDYLRQVAERPEFLDKLRQASDAVTQRSLEMRRTNPGMQAERKAAQARLP
ncbi:MAG TPA: hypothetical protein VHG30_02670 [Microvirga sp.]|nr:hypothetical protein [Microvirga sp.]